MTTMLLDADLRAKLNGATQTIAFTDEAGNVIGNFLPQEAYDRIMAVLLPPSSREEIAEARKEMLEHGGVSTAQIIASIEAAIRQAEAR